MTYDVVVIGGGPAGLSGAVALGRALRSVLVIDSGEPRNGPAEGIHNYLTRDGMSPADFRAAGRAEVLRFGGEVVDGRVVSVGTGFTATPGFTAMPGFTATPGFTVTLGDGREFGARRLLVTTGLVDVLPELPGLRERWGRTVLHCPYCHGFEERGKAIGIIGTGPMSVHQARMWRQWTPRLTLFTNEVVELAEEIRGVTVVAGRIEEIQDHGVRLENGDFHKADALVVAAAVAARAEPLVSLGLEVTDSEFGTFVPVEDLSGRTKVPGVWVAGNVTDFRAQVISSAAAGLAAGAAINFDLTEEDFA